MKANCDGQYTSNILKIKFRRSYYNFTNFSSYERRTLIYPSKTIVCGYNVVSVSFTCTLRTPVTSTLPPDGWNDTDHSERHLPFLLKKKGSKLLHQPWSTIEWKRVPKKYHREQQPCLLVPNDKLKCKTKETPRRWKNIYISPLPQVRQSESQFPSILYLSLSSMYEVDMGTKNCKLKLISHWQLFLPKVLWLKLVILYTNNQLDWSARHSSIDLQM